MDSRGGTNGKKVLSWIAAVVLIAAGAVAIGWFAGAALISYWTPANTAYPIDEEDDVNLPEGSGLDAEGDEQTAGTGSGQSVTDPAESVAGEPSGDASATDDSTAPFASPPWANNLIIKPLDEQVEEETEEPVDLIEPEVVVVLSTEPFESAGLQETEQPEPASTAVTAIEQPGTSLLFKVRVGPFPTKDEAAAAAVRLTELQYPTIVISNVPFYVQIGAFTVWENAENLLKKVQASGFAAVIVN